MPAMVTLAQRLYVRSCPDLRRNVCPGARMLLYKLSRRGIPAGLVTGNLSRIGWKKMERAGLQRYLRFGAFAELARDRAGLVRIAVRHARRQGWIDRTSPVALIGDHPNDIRAARANGVRSSPSPPAWSAEELAHAFTRYAGARSARVVAGDAHRMIRVALGGCVMACVLTLAACTSPQESGIKVIVGAQLQATPDAAPIPFSVVVIANDKFLAAGPQADVPVPKGADILRGTGKIIKPASASGRIAAGEPADLVLQNADSGSIEMTMHNGQWVR